MNQSGGKSIPPPLPRNNANNHGNHGNFRGRGRGGNQNHPHFGGGRGRGGGGGGGRGRGNGFGGMRNNHTNHHRYGPHGGGPHGGGPHGGMPPPPPPPPNNRNWRNDKHGGGGGRGRHNLRDRGRGGGGGPGGRTGGHFHHGHPPQHFQQGPPMQGAGQGPPFPQQQQQHHHQQQQGFIPPPPPSNFGGGPSQMRNGPPPPPPPPGQHNNHNNNYQPQHLNYQQQTPPMGIPPPPPKQWQQGSHTNNNNNHQINPQFQAQQYTHPPPFGQQQHRPQHQQLQMQQQPFPTTASTAITQQQNFAQQTGAHVLNNQYQQLPHQMHHPPQQQPPHLYSQQTQPQQNPVYNTLQQQTATTAQQSADPEQIASNWTTHKSPEGVDYYHNNVTKKSTYTLPPCLSQSKVSASSSATSTTIGNIQTSSLSNQKKGWTQHTDKATGKVYYYNGKTTTWDKPQDFIDPSSTTTATTTATTTLSSNSSSPSPQQPKKKRKKDNDTASVYSSKAEAIAAFKGLLLAKDISPTMKWNDVIKACSSDARWDACHSIGERKQALAEYQTKRAAELREQKRQEKVRAKDAFMSLLRDILPSVRVFDTSARFEDIRDSLVIDGRFHAVEDEKSRHELYFEFVEELRKRDERQRRGRKREAKDSFLAFLKSREEIGSLTFASTWNAFLLTLSEKDKEDPHFKTSPGMSDSDRQLYFADFVIELNAAEEEKKRRIQDARRRAEKAQRSAYRETLRTMAKEGKIAPTSRWRNCEEELSSHKSFGPVSDQDKNAPRDMFEDFVFDWADDYRRDKNFIMNLIDSSKDPITIEMDSEYDSFKEGLLKAAAFSPDAYSDARRVINDEDPVSSARLYFDEMVVKAKTGSAMLPKRRGYGRRDEDSSEDEGEIVEDEEDGQIVEKPVDAASPSAKKEVDSISKKDEESTTKKEEGKPNEENESNPSNESDPKPGSDSSKSSGNGGTNGENATANEETSIEGKSSDASMTLTASTT